MAEYDDYHLVGKCDLSAPQKAVLRTLLDHANKEYECWPSQDRIVRYTGLSGSTVRRALADLEELKVIHRRRREGGLTHYRLKIHNVPPCVEVGTVVRYLLFWEVLDPDEHWRWDNSGTVEEEVVISRRHGWTATPKIRTALLGSGRRPMGALVAKPKKGHSDRWSNEVVVVVTPFDEQPASKGHTHPWDNYEVSYTFRVLSIRKATQPELNTGQVGAKRSPRKR